MAALRILHSSDWHLGQLFFGHDRSAEHQCVLDWLLDILVQQRIDVLLIAGDIYDHAHPAASQQRQFHRFLVAARQRCPALQIVVIAGNHDSPARLEAPGPLLLELGIRVIGHYDPEQLDDLLIALHDADGEIAAWCLAVPYLRPSELPAASAGKTGDPYVDGVAQVYADLTQRAVQRRQPQQALVAMGHLHVRGGRTSDDSERKLVIGGAEMLDAGIFDPALDYVALGHLHLAQRVGSERVRYCGSPLPLSFSELDYPHQVLCVVLNGPGSAQIHSIAVPRFVPLLRIPAQPQALEAVLVQLRALDVTAAAGLEPFVEVQVLLEQPEPALGARVQAALDGKSVRFTRVQSFTARSATAAQTATDDVVPMPDLSQLDPAQLLANHYQQQYGQPLPDALASAFLQMLREVQY